MNKKYKNEVSFGRYHKNAMDMVYLNTVYFAENWKKKKKKNFWLLLINKIIVHLPNYTVYVPWIVQEALDLKKKNTQTQTLEL